MSELNFSLLNNQGGDLLYDFTLASFIDNFPDIKKFNHFFFLLNWKLGLSTIKTKVGKYPGKHFYSQLLFDVKYK